MEDGYLSTKGGDPGLHSLPAAQCQEATLFTVHLHPSSRNLSLHIFSFSDRTCLPLVVSFLAYQQKRTLQNYLFFGYSFSIKTTQSYQRGCTICPISICLTRSSTRKSTTVTAAATLKSDTKNPPSNNEDGSRYQFHSSLVFSLWEYSWLFFLLSSCQNNPRQGICPKIERGQIQ